MTANDNSAGYGSANKGFVDASLAHGYAYNILREMADRSKLSGDKIRKLIANGVFDEMMNERRAGRLVRQFDDIIGTDRLWRFSHTGVWKTRVAQAPAVTGWSLPLAGRRSGMILVQVVLVFNKRRPVDVLQHIIMDTNPHTLARLLQRGNVRTKEEVTETLKGVVQQIGLLRLLAARLGHRQWGIPVGDGLLIGEIDRPGDDDPRLGHWSVSAKTYISSMNARWSRVHAAMNWAASRIREADPALIDYLCMDMPGSFSDEPAVKPLFDAFSSPEYDWLTHGYTEPAASPEDIAFDGPVS